VLDFIVAFSRKYKKDSGMGTIIAIVGNAAERPVFLPPEKNKKTPGLGRGFLSAF